MAAMLDIMGSLALRGVILALVMNLVITLRDAEYEKTSVATTTQNLATTARIIEKDLRYAGYNLDTLSTSAFLMATTQRVRFLGDIDDSGGADTIDVRIADDPSGESGSKVIARTRNSELPLYIAKGPLTMNIQYFDSLGAVTPDLSSIVSISVLLSQINTYSGVDTSLTTLTKEILVFPANLY